MTSGSNSSIMLRINSLCRVLLPLTLYITSLRSCVSAATIESRQTIATRVIDLARVENVAVRSNGQILATNMNSVDLYTVDPIAKTLSIAITISGANGLSGIAEVNPDVFAVVGGKAIYTVDFNGNSTRSTLVGTIVEASNLNGLAALNNDTVLVADAGTGVVYRVNLSTRAYSIALYDTTMSPPIGINFGINGIKYSNETVWYTNLFKTSFSKVTVDATGTATSNVTTLWTDLMGDDLCFGPHSMIYIATNGKNLVVEADPVTAKRKTVATVTGSTSCAFGRTDQDSNVMYVGAAQGIFSVTIE